MRGLCEGSFVAEMEFAVCAYEQFDFAKGLAGADELLHGELGELVVRSFIVVAAGTAAIAGEPEVVTIALVVEVREVCFTFAAEVRALCPCAD